MNPTLVLCEGATRPPRYSRNGQAFELRHQVKPTNLCIRVENVSQSILRELKPRTRDLLRIAAYVYGADTSVRRGTPKDVWADHWTRGFHLVIPVEDESHWARREVTEALVAAVNYATGDEFTFSFVPGSPALGQLHLDLGEGVSPQADVVTLFSGGIDSLGAVIDLVKNEGRHPVLVSHRSVAKINSRQQRLVSLLKARMPGWSFPHVSVWAHRQIARAVENTQRSRAFMYLSMATAVAAELGIHDVRIYDNGVMSVNLPRLAQTVGTMATRSTHPVFLQRFHELAQLSFDGLMTVSNPFLMKTRVEVVELIREAGQADMLQETVSCARTEGMTDLQPHCGTCTQCVDRRFATISAGVEDHDLPERYEKDVFVADLKEGDERTYAESYVRAAVEFSSLSDDDYFIKYPELQECVPALAAPTDATARALVDVHRRHAKAVLGTLRARTDALWDEHVAGKLPDTCLVALVAGRKHLKDSRAAYARRLGMLMSAHVPKAFRSRPAKDEVHFQDAADAVFGAAQERLAREAPQIPFGAVTTKPDFADLRDTLFVEMKYPKSREGLRRAVTEMTSRILVYKDQGAFALFVVYDPKRAIRDDDDFTGSLEKHGGVWVAISR